MSFEERPLTDDFCVSPQIELEDIPELIAAGFKSIIINRPDGEGPEQPLNADLTALSEENGLEVRDIPMAPGQLSPEMVSQTFDAIEEMPKPILAFCASGTRSTILWCCANAKELGVDAVLSTALNAGYDLEQIRPLLNQISQ